MQDETDAEGTDRLSAEEMAGRAELVLADLLTATGADRCTLRYDDPDRGWTVQLPCAEVLIGEAKSLRAENSVDQRAAAAVNWLQANRRILVQPDLADTDAPAPAALIRAYGVRAQMLGPLFRELAPHGITVNAVAQGPVETPIDKVFEFDNPKGDAHRAFLRERTPSGVDFYKVEDVVGTVLYLASPMSDAVTGVTIPVDGGWCAW